MGRPPKPKAEQLAEIVPIRLTRAEREACEQAANRADAKLTTWMRDRLVRTAKRENKSD